MRDKTLLKTTLLWMDKTLYVKLQEYCKQEDRSMTRQIIRFIKEGLKED